MDKDRAVKDYKAKQKRISNEKRRLNEIFKEVDSKKKRSVRGLIEEAAFMKATLDDLKQIVNKSGVLDEMIQGDYTILREHPAVKSYNGLVQRYTAVTEKLSLLLPKEPKEGETDDGFNDFVGGRGD